LIFYFFGAAFWQELAPGMESTAFIHKNPQFLGVLGVLGGQFNKGVRAGESVS
jgi:hypothetical protein